MNESDVLARMIGGSTIDVRGVLPSALDMIDELTLPASEVHGGRMGGDVLLEEIAAEDAPDLVSSLVKALESCVVESLEIHITCS